MLMPSPPKVTLPSFRPLSADREAFLRERGYTKGHDAGISHDLMPLKTRLLSLGGHAVVLFFAEPDLEAILDRGVLLDGRVAELRLGETVRTRTPSVKWSNARRSIPCRSCACASRTARCFGSIPTIYRRFPMQHPQHEVNAESGFLASGTCGMCDAFFTFDASRVPCFPLDTSKPPGRDRLEPLASQEPVCRSCFRDINALRSENGKPPHAEDPAFWGERTLGATDE